MNGKRNHCDITPSIILEQLRKIIKTQSRWKVSGLIFEASACPTWSRTTNPIPTFISIETANSEHKNQVERIRLQYVCQPFSSGLCELAVFNCSQIPSLDLCRSVCSSDVAQDQSTGVSWVKHSCPYRRRQQDVSHQELIVQRHNATSQQNLIFINTTVRISCTFYFPWGIKWIVEYYLHKFQTAKH